MRIEWPINEDDFWEAEEESEALKQELTSGLAVQLPDEYVGQPQADVQDEP